MSQVPHGASVLSDHGGAGATLFEVLEVADRLYERVAQALAPGGLTFAAYELLAQLREAKGPVRVDDFADAHGCALATVLDVLHRLEAEGLVAMQADRLVAELTPLGSARVLDCSRRLHAPLAEFAAAFDARERVALSRLLRRVPRRAPGLAAGARRRASASDP